jgi:endonuclease/exonuclease/phosphatase family metal-dependent hydrolase
LKDRQGLGRVSSRAENRVLIRVLTYNVHRCVGTDGKPSPERIAEIIAACAPDIVALQEVDVLRRRTGVVDQAHLIARLLDMTVHFHPAVRVRGELYGDAILTALPSRLVAAGKLPHMGWVPKNSPRGAMWVGVDVGNVELQVINTHLGLLGTERRLQVQALLGPRWLGHPACQQPMILLGDLNAVPASAAYRRLRTQLHDVQRGLGFRPRATFPSQRPMLRLDHIFHRGGIVVHRVEVIRTPLARTASDHLPLLAEIELTAAASQTIAAAA